MVIVRRWMLLALCVHGIRAERLPVRVYTPADGLPAISIHRIVRDRAGFLWFCTADGLSRFDGLRFVNYGAADGLPQQDLEDLIENGDGTYWIATVDGLVHFDASAVRSGRPRFTSHSLPGGREANWVHTLARVADGSVPQHGQERRQSIFRCETPVSSPGPCRRTRRLPVW